MAWDPSTDTVAQQGFATCDRVLEMIGDRADALVVRGRGTNALTRFANSRIHQNMASDDDHVRLRVVVEDGRIAQASTTRVDVDGLERLVEHTIAAARFAEIADLDGHGSSSHKIAPLYVRFSLATDR